MSHPQESSLLSGYDGIVSDLDGVVYRGVEAIPYAVESLTRAGEHVGVVYATNNASRTTSAICAQLTGVGLSVRTEHVVTSAIAGAARLADELPADSKVLAVGGEGVFDALRAVGLDPERTAVPGIPAVLQGYGSQVTAMDLAEATLAISAGARWVATNTDRTLPTDRGDIPGNGALVGAVRMATGREPVVVGKPYPPLYALAAQVLGTSLERTLAIGDRLETDIAGAQAAGMHSVWVLTGVHGLRDLALGSATPTYAALDLRELHEPYDAVERDGPWWVCGSVRLRQDSEHVVAEPDWPALQSTEARRVVLRAGARMVVDLRDSGLPKDVVSALATRLDEHIGRRAGAPGAQ